MIADTATEENRKRWIESIKDILNKHGYSATKAIHLALESPILTIDSKCGPLVTPPTLGKTEDWIFRNVTWKEM